MSWVKIDYATPDKPEIHAMAVILNTTPNTVLGCMFRLWSWLDANIKDDQVPAVTKPMIDRIGNHKGLSDALLSVGWLVDADGVLLIKNATRHNGKAAKKRAVTSKRVASFRKNQTTACNATSVTNVTLTALQERYKCNADSVTNNCLNVNNSANNINNSAVLDECNASSVTGALQTLSPSFFPPCPPFPLTTPNPPIIPPTISQTPTSLKINQPMKKHDEAVKSSLDAIADQELRQAFKSWFDSRRQMGKPLTDVAIQMQIKKLSKYSKAIQIASLEDSTANGWQGVFPEKIAGNARGAYKTPIEVGLNNSADKYGEAGCKSGGEFFQ